MVVYNHICQSKLERDRLSWRQACLHISLVAMDGEPKLKIRRKEYIQHCCVFINSPILQAGVAVPRQLLRISRYPEPAFCYPCCGHHLTSTKSYVRPAALAITNRGKVCSF